MVEAIGNDFLYLLFAFIVLIPIFQDIREEFYNIF